ncbi:hypothetical protein E0H26_02150 [Micromonospora zingiberis]|uniref:Uncharacterized protein n=1 Tax=Micromonospora zingiberis TaxID=2053011 RepID=A0A4R0GTU9_9ACTN|nr:hypothetical protein [Micromonospora zingiberis]TCC00508.1 hypothetical protein E0H26_02150 [Micromonospora zingiberis]
MTDLGAKVSYLALAAGTPVYAPDSTMIGMVEHVLADERQDIFHGVIIAPSRAHHTHRFAHREQIADLYERGVLLSVPAAALHEPGTDTPAEQAEEADDPVRLGLRRAWEWLVRAR